MIVSKAAGTDTTDENRRSWPSRSISMRPRVSISVAISLGTLTGISVATQPGISSPNGMRSNRRSEVTSRPPSLPRSSSVNAQPTGRSFHSTVHATGTRLSFDA